jgi:uncharacterized damage-inducible protein DinB
MTDAKPEPWLRGGRSEVAAVPRAVVHALELAAEDLRKWCADLSEAELHARPAGLPSVAFQLRHIARSVDRLLTYAEGRTLDAGQMAGLKSEANPGVSSGEILEELKAALVTGMERVVKLGADVARLEEVRAVGREKLPTTVGGLLVHVADHTQRHVGQAITTAKVIYSQRPGDDLRQLN